MRSKVARSRDSLTRVAASVALSVSRAVRPTSALAASASSASEGEMRSSARRRSPMNSRILSSILSTVGGSAAGDAPRRPRSDAPRRPQSWRQDFVERALDALEILLVLHEHRQGGLDERRIERLRVEDDERARPVERLRDRRRLAQLERPDLLHGG